MRGGGGKVTSTAPASAVKGASTAEGGNGSPPKEGQTAAVGRWRNANCKAGSSAVAQKYSSEVEKAMLILSALQKDKGEAHPDTVAAKTALDEARARRDAARPPQNTEPTQARITLEAKEAELAQAQQDLVALEEERS